MIKAWVSSKTDGTPILVTEDCVHSRVFQRLADRYAARLARILRKNEAKKRLVTFATIEHYTQAEANVRALDLQEGQ